MSAIDSYMDLFVSPILTNNNTLNSISKVNAENPSVQTETFEKILDDINEQFGPDIEDMSSPKKSSETKKEDEEKTIDNLLNLLGNNFGPPMGLEIENFDYSLIK